MSPVTERVERSLAGTVTFIREATVLGRRQPRIPGRWRWILASAVLLFLALSIGNSLTRAPWWDEGLFTDVALTFKNTGHLGSSVLAATGYTLLPRVDQYTYWQFPVYLIGLGYWLKAVPWGVEAVRSFATVFGAAYLFCWFVLAKSLSRSVSLACFVVAVVALDYSLIGAASDGRMDMMCAALGQAALAIYLYLRKPEWTLAIALAGWFGAAALFCHPMGLVVNAELALLLLMDRSRLKWRGLLAAGIPYLIAGAAWALYAMQAPLVFQAQMAAASGYRVSGLLAVLRNVMDDVGIRYLNFYFASLPGIAKLKVFCLVFALAGFLGLLCTRRLRSQELPRTLLSMSVVAYIGVAILDNQKFPIYFVYVMPLLSACAAVWTYECWRHSGLWRTVSAALLACSVAATISGYIYKIRRDDFGSLYLPAMHAVRQSMQTGGAVMGGSELGFALGFKRPLIDDRYLGFFSKIQPQVYVSSYYYGEMWGAHLHQAWVWSQILLAQHYHLVFRNSAYRVYVRNKTGYK